MSVIEVTSIILNEPHLLIHVLARSASIITLNLAMWLALAVLPPCLFNLYAEYIMQNARLNEIQAGIKIAGRNINNLRFADDTTLMAEREEG